MAHPTEAQIQAEILRIVGGRPDVRLFRNNVALSWVGSLVSNHNGRVVLDNARPLHAGLFVGSGDLIGWRVRDGIAQFLSIECKSHRGTPSPEQYNWRAVVQSSGGVGLIVKSVDEALRGIV